MSLFKEDFIQYNWLISDYDCNYYPDNNIQHNEFYVWLNGLKLFDIISSNEIQFIWGTFSGFDKSILYEDVIKYKIPRSECYDHWSKKDNTQNPLAIVEIVSWDSSSLLFKSKEDKFIDIFKKEFVQSIEI